MIETADVDGLLGLAQQAKSSRHRGFPPAALPGRATKNPFIVDAVMPPLQSAGVEARPGAVDGRRLGVPPARV